ncbi:hypothetical protein [Deinococcus peraridilitoris]|uniref:DUF4037 domain-containing protein n=1 Tax=Deinococcus peraridilitoris (strain DSM 19664 / LMG 22246 / CIP 109416 / KR-200) TaxID=937777 RepID=L0A4X3_DEIPD|nr:hypothetical protein [Deinococcus peraridilitoris]AFZ68911.1 hypothetical protein Deipe_3478 [Deinococcus peraridilitoris DSM 19664]
MPAEPARILERLVTERKVRAVAWAGSFATENAWSGSVPTIVTFERGLLSHHTETRAGLTQERFPYEQLEAWRDWDTAREQAPLGLLATSRVAYDPTGYFARIQKTLWGLSDEKRAAYRSDLLNSARSALEQAQREFTGPGQGVAGQLQCLVIAREVALTFLYPALLTWLHAWPEFEIRLPHAWRAVAGLKFPRAVYHLESLYGFAGEDEARRVLLASRGLGLVEQERRARAAFQAGYFDGAVRLLRDEAARTHRADLVGWNHLSTSRRERLASLLGLERSPLGPTALQATGKLLEACREGA